MYINKIFKRYFAFVMIVGAFAMGMEYSPAVNDYMSTSYVSVVGSMDNVLESKTVLESKKVVRAREMHLAPGKVEVLSKAVEAYIKPGTKDLVIFHLNFSGTEYVLDHMNVKIEGGENLKKVAIYDAVNGEFVANGKEKNGYWKFEMLDFSGTDLVIKGDLKKDSFPGDRLRASLENNSDIVFGVGTKKADFPLSGNYLTIVGK